MKPIKITRTARIPDPLRILRYRKAPELGPNILFFSGGTALNGVSRVLKNYTYNSIHMVTPFDSGGSSAKLRQAFRMPAIGDVRSRLMALADDTVIGHPSVYRLFTYRFSRNTPNEALTRQLDSMIQGRDPLIHSISNPMRRLIRNQMGYFQDAMPPGFDLRGASIGNLILSGGYLNNHKHLDPIIFLFSKLIEARGAVRAIVNDDLHLAAELEDGSRIIGQHRLTGKETTPLASPIRNLHLCKSLRKFDITESELKRKNRKLLEKADLICFPPGSFYTSLIANLLPRGVGATIASNECPKVYVPNLGVDPEQIGLNMDQAVVKLLGYLQKDTKNAEGKKRLDFVLVDQKRGNYPSRLTASLMSDMGLQIIDTTLISEQSAPHYDPDLLVAALLSLT
ncbi:MAG: GAK system CofD-like protein [Gammaproteobacteria bacterium]|nr:GAK system CofD-like protein [Gammaproteobacteria bacterium]